MGLNQGYNKYSEGYTRVLTKSELTRGYLFISKDKRINSISDLTIKIGDMEFYKTIDSSGRIFVGQSVLANIGAKKITYRLEGETLSISY